MQRLDATAKRLRGALERSRSATRRASELLLRTLQAEFKMAVILITLIGVALYGSVLLLERLLVAKDARIA